MISVPSPTKIIYGDFQTPLTLAHAICQKLIALDIAPDVIIEPTCGIGAFIESASYAFTYAKKIIGLDINPDYLQEIAKKQISWPQHQRISLKQVDFFNLDWTEIINHKNENILVLGNFPWVTNAQQGVIGSQNLPTKANDSQLHGLSALTGKSNFDISEWMLRQTAVALHQRPSYLAMLCKQSVARKFFAYLETQQLYLKQGRVYPIDAQKEFGASVSACLLLCEFDGVSHHYDYEVYEDFEGKKFQQVGRREGLMVQNLSDFERLRFLHGGTTKWRSGVKHDCAEVMELTVKGDSYENGLGEAIDIEPTYVFPLLKGSDIANNRTQTTQRAVLITQKNVGDPTKPIQFHAPKTWAYLEAHTHLFEKRKSRIYAHKPPFAIFGVGNYTFAPYKIAICSLYKRLTFQVIGPINGCPVLFDDTVYFLSFATQTQAQAAWKALNSSMAKTFLEALIFWDEKRPIKTSILNNLNLSLLENLMTKTTTINATPHCK